MQVATDKGTHENCENGDQNITITGNKDSISVAKNLIEIRYNCIVKFMITFLESGAPKPIFNGLT